MTRARRAAVGGLLAAAVAGTIVAVGAARSAASAALRGAAAEPVELPGFFLPGVNFVASCRFSHRAADDPIVYPGEPGASHDHSFFGNTSTDAFSTLSSLRASGTSCRRPGDTAAYWVPTLLDPQGNPVEPSGASVYYRRSTIQPLEAFPARLRVIAGDAMATGPQPMRITHWSCGIASAVPRSSEIPACPVGRGTEPRLHVRFPSCWNGRSLDSPDHRSHMAYPERGRCPAGYPVEVPAISLVVRYPVWGGDGFALASGGPYTAHADFFNAWDQGVLETLVDRCLNALRHCGRAS